MCTFGEIGRNRHVLDEMGRNGQFWGEMGMFYRGIAYNPMPIHHLTVSSSVFSGSF